MEDDVITQLRHLHCRVKFTLFLTTALQLASWPQNRVAVTSQYLDRQAPNAHYQFSQCRTKALKALLSMPTHFAR